MTGTLIISAASSDGSDKKPTFNLDAYNGGKMSVAGWPYPVVVDGQGVMLVSQGIPIYASHEQTIANLVGQTQEVKVDGNGRITASGPLTASRESSTTYAQMLDHASNGYKWQSSIGAEVLDYEYVDTGKTATVNGQSFDGPMYISRKTSLNHVAIVPLGADTTTKANIAAQGGNGKEKIMNFEKWLIAQGKDINSLGDDEKAKLQAAFNTLKGAGLLEASTKPAEQPKQGTQPKPVEAAADGDTGITAANAARAANLRRIAAIDQLQASYATVKQIDVDGKPVGVAEFCASAIEAGTAASEVELALLRASRAPSKSGMPAIHVHAGISDASDKVIEASIALKHHAIGDDKQLVAAYGEQVLEAATKLRGARLSKLIEIVCGNAGVQLPLAVDDAYIRAAFSNTALSGILGNVANKALAASFMSVNQVIPRIARARSHMNFHAHTVYSMALNGDLVEVSPRGELQHMNLSEESYTRQVKTRGAVLRISRTDLVNDELGAFLDMAQRLGRKAALSRERVGFKALNGTGNGESFFTAANGNYISGPATALSYASLGKAVQTMRDQVGPDGDPIGIEPRILLVPTALEVTARELTNPNATLIATALGSNGAAKREPQVNVWAGAFRPEVSEWLGKTIDKVPGSSTAWYLLADPEDVAAVEVSYLNGNDQPVIEFFGLSSEVDTLGVSWRCYFDFGVDMAEFRAAVKSKGGA